MIRLKHESIKSDSTKNASDISLRARWVKKMSDSSQKQTYQPNNFETKLCPYCNFPNRPTDTYCKYCEIPFSAKNIPLVRRLGTSVRRILDRLFRRVECKRLGEGLKKMKLKLRDLEVY